jgi:hypothetical protein
LLQVAAEGIQTQAREIENNHGAHGWVKWQSLCLTRIYQQHPDEQILVQTAQILGVEVEQIRSFFEQSGETSD